jgi:hypothetical protein
MTIAIILSVGLALLIAVLVRSAMTLADISHSLERLADSRQEVRVSVQPQKAEPVIAVRTEPDDSEIAAVIAVARAAMDGAVTIAS